MVPLYMQLAPFLNQGEFFFINFFTTFILIYLGTNNNYYKDNYLLIFIYKI